ncbi:hypothetical protein GCM10029964_038500 [Kibdelosporangium lantanae]
MPPTSGWSRGWTVADAEVIRGTSGWTRVLVEIIGGSADTAVARADEILAVLDVRPLLHGEEDACWPLVERAWVLGLDTRIGLEDTTVGRVGEPVTGNAELVRSAVLAREPRRG